MTKRFATPAALVVLAALLSGCAVGPNYKRPAVTAPAEVRGASAAEAASLADRPWWEVFGDDAVVRVEFVEHGSHFHQVRHEAVGLERARGAEHVVLESG